MKQSNVPSLFRSVIDSFILLFVSCFLIVVYCRIFSIARKLRKIDGKTIRSVAAATAAAAECVEHNRSIGSRDSITAHPPAVHATNGNKNCCRKTSSPSMKVRRQWKAVLLTAVMAGLFVVMWFPYTMIVTMTAAGISVACNHAVIDVCIGIGMFNFSFTWIIYAAVSKQFQQAYRRTILQLIVCRRNNSVCNNSANA